MDLPLFRAKEESRMKHLKVILMYAILKADDIASYFFHVNGDKALKPVFIPELRTQPLITALKMPATG